MQCAECGVRSAVGYCGECETLLCEVCGRTCSQCGKVACRSHLQRTSSGRNICVSCVVLHYDKRARQSKERRERRAEEAALGGKTHKHHKHHKHDKPKAETESLSFEALARDMSPAPIPVFVPEPEEVPRETPALDNRHHHDTFDHGPLRSREALNTRVLTGSATTGTPTWITGLGVGLFSWLLCFAATGETVLPLQDGILSVVAFVLSVGAVAWTAPAALIKEAVPLRTRSRIALGIGAGALLYSTALNIVHWL